MSRQTKQIQLIKEIENLLIGNSKYSCFVNSARAGKLNIKGAIIYCI